MLEALLNHFRSYGMNDLEFMIVNSKLSHSQDKFHELQKRVSFSVYQETDEEEVWSVMEGGKDDMYVYDRCGRLTYFIPFPLSILNESPLVSNAILATYFQSPCGASCDQNKSIGIDEFVKNMERGFEGTNETEQEDIAYEVTEQYIANNETNNETISNEVFAAIDPEIEFGISNSTDFNNITDYDYPVYNGTSHLNDTNSTSVDKARTFFSNIYRLFFNADKNNETVEEKNTTLSSMLTNETNTEIQIDTDLHHHSHHTHHKHGHEHKHKDNPGDKKKSDRCLEADYQVCKNWSKRRLLHAQKCCSETHAHDVDNHEHASCRNFGKKRCKKIQSILKCCIKTEYTEPSAVPSIEGTVQTTEVRDVVCCKRTDEGKFCRVLTSGDCQEGEERSLSQSK